jgi:hypothetical protein
MAKIKINYGISKGRGKKLVGENHQMVVDDSNDFKKIYNLISEKHPGWRIQGWTVVE